MKLCILHNSSPGGAARLVWEVASRLSETDEVAICTWGDNPESSPPGVEALWCPGPRLKFPSPIHPFGNLARSYLGSWHAARVVDRRGFDVALVLACQWAQAPEVLRRLRTPHLYFAQEGRRRSVESNYLPSPTRNGVEGALWGVGRRCYDAIGSMLDRRAIAAAQSVATNSPFTARQLAAAYGVSATVIELGVDTKRFGPGGERSEGPVALLVGGLDPTKGGELAIRSLALVPAEHRPALRIISNRGDESYGAMLIELGHSTAVRVDVLMSISDEALLAEYQGAAMLLALAVNEPFGLTVLEASACGTPTVAIAEGGYLRTVDPSVNGILVDRDMRAIALAVTEIVTKVHGFDRTKMAAWTTERWSWNRCVKDLRELLVGIGQQRSVGPDHPRNFGVSGPAR